jgi:hypothetical protein
MSQAYKYYFADTMQGLQKIAYILHHCHWQCNWLFAMSLDMPLEMAIANLIANDISNGIANDIDNGTGSMCIATQYGHTLVLHCIHCTPKLGTK